MTGGGRPADDYGRLTPRIAGHIAEALATSMSLKISVPVGIAEYRGLGDSRCFEGVVDEVRSFRAEVYFDSGRRPYFRAADGSFGDPDDSDYHACHMTCRDRAGRLMGCFRVARVDVLPSSIVEDHLGPERSAALVGELGIGRHEVAELSRLAVAPECRRQGAAAALLMAAHALARRMGCRVQWSSVLEVNGQHRYVIRGGSAMVPGSSRWVPKFGCNLCVAIHDYRVTLPRIGEAISIVDQAVFNGARSPGVAR
jgi:GNAT superfamily N-acetyltransferase